MVVHADWAERRGSLSYLRAAVMTEKSDVRCHVKCDVRCHVRCDVNFDVRCDYVMTTDCVITNDYG